MFILTAGKPLEEPCNEGAVGKVGEPVCRWVAASESFSITALALAFYRAAICVYPMDKRIQRQGGK